MQRGEEAGDRKTAEEDWSGKRRQVWDGGEHSYLIVDPKLSGENGGEKVELDLGLEDVEYEGEVCGEVEGEMPDQGVGLFRKLDVKRSEV